ncbi:MAG: PucR family transcriptional regulator [Bifidobacteriaceae bacterium]|jgi:purine catabolism regulator|nr:PucR family transcriptional regulator [Bifidobacteriaceae bacterium]
MSVTVRDIIDLPLLAPSRPQVLAGEDKLDREVRWVHTSEIFDIAPLLRGGEVLLTSGLGLVGAREERQREYVLALADQDVSALMIEVGRTFLAVPAVMLDAARQAGLPLVVLSGTVPFIQVVETVHRRLMDADYSALLARDEFRRRLTDALITGGGFQGVLDVIGEVLAVDAAIETAPGRIIADTDQRDPTAADAALAITVTGQPWGRLLVWSEGRELDEGLLDCCLDAISLELLRTSRIGTSRAQREYELVSDIISGNFASAADIRSQCASLNLSAGAGESFLVIAVTPGVADRAAQTLATLAAVAQHSFVSHVAANSSDQLLAIGVGRAMAEPRLRRFLESLRAKLEAQSLPKHHGGILAVAADPVPDAADLTEAVRQAREACDLATRLGIKHRSLLARDLGVARLLASAVDDSELERFVVEQLGPILERDAARRSDLVLTLDAYFAAGLSKTKAAQALGIRRQTMYQRLERIGELLGASDINLHERRTALEIAVLAWRLRTANYPVGATTFTPAASSAAAKAASGRLSVTNRST